VVTGPDDIRARFATHSVAELVAELVALRPRTGEVVGYATRMALRELGDVSSSSTANSWNDLEQYRGF